MALPSSPEVCFGLDRAIQTTNLNVRLNSLVPSRSPAQESLALSTIDTKERILDTAERLFADHGFAETSLRTITNEAGVNLAAVHYHFGGKEDLIRAVFVRRLGALHRERLERLDACEARAGGEPVALEEVLEAYLGPALRLSLDKAHGGEVFMRLLGRVHAEPGDHFKKIYCPRFSELVQRYAAALQRTLPELPEVELYWRLHFLHGVMSHAMCDSEKLALVSGGLCNASDADSILARMVPFLAAGLRAPAPPAGSLCDCSDELDEARTGQAQSRSAPHREVSLA